GVQSSFCRLARISRNSSVPSARKKSSSGTCTSRLNTASSRIASTYEKRLPCAYPAARAALGSLRPERLPKILPNMNTGKVTGCAAGQRFAPPSRQQRKEWANNISQHGKSTSAYLKGGVRDFVRSRSD